MGGERAMQVRDRMTRNVVTVSRSCGIRAAAELMKARRIRHLPVVEGGRLLGIVTDRDLREAMPPAQSIDVSELQSLLAEVQVSEIMTTRVVGVSPDVSIARAADLMVRNQIGCLPVLEGEALVGVITASDILRAVAEREALAA
jgi:acetoin utilization protein AcuB